MNDASAETSGLDYVHLDEVGRLAGLAASDWRAIELAADRGDLLTIGVHCKQVVAVTREALSVLSTLGSQEVQP